MATPCMFYACVLLLLCLPISSMQNMEEEDSEAVPNKRPKIIMPYRSMGRTGLRVSALAYGSWVTFDNQVDKDDAFKIMKTAFQAGINLFDNAEGYSKGGAETMMGEAVKKGIEEEVWNRTDLVLTTKLFFGGPDSVPMPDGVKRPNAVGLSRKHVIEGLQASLSRMGLTYVDIVYCHREDPHTPIEETVRAMNHVLDRGWALYWGTSEWSSQSITEANRIAERLGMVGPSVEQPEYNVFERQRVEVEYQPIYQAFGTGLTTYSPLASGLLTGKYSGMRLPMGSRLSLPQFDYVKEDKFGSKSYQFAKADELKPIAKDLGCSLAQLSIAWVLSNPRVSSCILGASSEGQLLENLGALAVVKKLTPGVMGKINAIVGQPSYDRHIQKAMKVRDIDEL
eukprot:NODE_2675_length_1364_cov_158.626108_g2541_i0.p1 GENE.NODE_2675_length_1364_cov_158.626108_g2541_i0~~NODE_2675_length_1364_cov_158.626108_g2541_i0.p1  ORF type:complete len:415 (+),score=70.73 NODE_2675_length_1364_cov_158.626108_g2541_i0:59-1246(+)